jgi:hypothetical protein
MWKLQKEAILSGMWKFEGRTPYFSSTGKLLTKTVFYVSSHRPYLWNWKCEMEAVLQYVETSGRGLLSRYMKTSDGGRILDHVENCRLRPYFLTRDGGRVFKYVKTLGGGHIFRCVKTSGGGRIFRHVETSGARPYF